MAQDTTEVVSSCHSLADVKSVFRKWLFIEDDRMLDAVFGTIVANRFKDNPIWLFLVAPPSSMKTEILLTISKLEETFLLSKLTPKTLLSGSKDLSHSLLNRLRDHGKSILILKDFTTILEMERGARADIMSQLREVADGHMTYCTGNGMDIEWHGHLGMLAGVTDDIDRAHVVQNSLGTRFIFYRIEAQDDFKSSKQAQRNVGKRNQMRGEMQDAVVSFFNTLPIPEAISIGCSEMMSDRISKLAKFTALSRTGINRDGVTRIVDVIPTPEGSPRLSQQFKTLGIGISVVHGTREIGESEYDILKKIAIDTVPKKRVVSMRHLYCLNELQKLRTRELAVSVNMPASTVKELLEDMSMLNMVTKELVQDDSNKEDDFTSRRDTRAYCWKLEESFRELLREIKVFHTGELDFKLDVTKPPAEEEPPPIPAGVQEEIAF